MRRRADAGQPVGTLSGGRTGCPQPLPAGDREAAQRPAGGQRFGLRHRKLHPPSHIQQRGIGAAGITFVVAAPTTTIDLETPNGGVISIEERDPDEVIRHSLAPPGTPARNPAFDVTPAEYVSALVTERGVARPVNLESVQRLAGTPDTRRSAASHRSPLPR